MVGDATFNKENFEPTSSSSSIQASSVWFGLPNIKSIETRSLNNCDAFSKQLKLN